MSRLCRASLWIAILTLLAGVEAHAIGWSGRVIDIRTGEPVAGVEIRGGSTGRYDVTPKAVTGADGRFTVVYPEHQKQPEFFALHAQPQPQPPVGEGEPDVRYLPVEERRPTPGEAVVKLVPRWAYIRGRVVDAETGQPLAGIEIAAAVTGRYLSQDKVYRRAVTDEKGEYTMRVPASRGRIGVEGTPAANRPPDTPFNHAKPVTDYWLDVNYGGSAGRGKEYVSLQTRVETAPGKKEPIPIPVLSSVEPVIFTRVDIRLPKKSAAEKPVTELVSVTPPAAPGGAPAFGEGVDVLARLDALIRATESLLADMRRLRDELKAAR